MGSGKMSPKNLVNNFTVNPSRGRIVLQMMEIEWKRQWWLPER